MSTPMARMFAGILVQFAEWELQSIGERRRNGQNREKPKVRKIATGKTFRQHWQDMDDEQRHAYLKSASVHVLVVRKEDYTARKEELAVRTASEQGTQAADDLILDIPMNVVTEAGGKYVASIGLGTLREQLQHVAAA